MVTELLEILRRQARIPNAELAQMLGCTELEVGQALERLEREKIILGYQAVLNPEKLTAETASAIIEVKVTPQRDVGFDRIAERIYRFPQVRSMCLMSGTYDFLLEVEGRNIKEISFFVFEKLATLEHVQSTVTHFQLRKYKESGVVLTGEEELERLPVTP